MPTDKFGIVWPGSAVACLGCGQPMAVLEWRHDMEQDHQDSAMRKVRTPQNAEVGHPRQAQRLQVQILPLKAANREAEAESRKARLAQPQLLASTAWYYPRRIQQIVGLAGWPLRNVSSYLGRLSRIQPERRSLPQYRSDPGATMPPLQLVRGLDRGQPFASPSGRGVPSLDCVHLPLTRDDVIQLGGVPVFGLTVEEACRRAGIGYPNQFVNVKRGALNGK